MRHEYKKLINEHDKTLSMLRKQWMSAEGQDRNKYQQRIDEALDERLRLMKLRDAEVLSAL